MHSHVPISLIKLLGDKEIMLGVIAEAMKYVPKERIRPCTNCGMAPMRRDIAKAKLAALGAGAALARERLG